jgi:hypothetical protein
VKIFIAIFGIGSGHPVGIFIGFISTVASVVQILQFMGISHL